MCRTFEKGDSNRCRNVYEQILRAGLPASVLEAQKKNKHVSVGRCRMLAINHRIALPTYEALSKVSFVETRVPREDWSVPTDCKRFLKKLAEEGLCRGRCETCDQLTGASPLPVQPARSRQSARVTRPPGWDRPQTFATGAEIDDAGFQTTPPSSEPATPSFGPLLAMSELEDCMQNALVEQAIEQALPLLGGASDVHCGGGGRGGGGGGGCCGGAGGGEGGGGEAQLHEHGALLESSRAFEEGTALLGSPIPSTHPVPGHPAASLSGLEDGTGAARP